MNSVAETWIQEGREKGRAEGQAQGQEQERSRMIMQMRAAGLSAQEISLYTGLSVQEIEEN